MNVKTLLDQAANVAIICAATIVSIAYARPLLAPPVSRPPEGRPPSYARGDVLPTLPGLHPLPTERTFLILVSSGCAYCTKEIPFYQELVKQRRQGSANVVVASRDEPSTLRAYLAKHRLEPDRIVDVASGTDLKLRLTPSILVLDREGRVLDTWTGATDAGAKETLLDLAAR